MFIVAVEVPELQLIDVPHAAQGVPVQAVIPAAPGQVIEPPLPETAVQVLPVYWQSAVYVLWPVAQSVVLVPSVTATTWPF
jgi:hypothetical protein